MTIHESYRELHEAARAYFDAVDHAYEANEAYETISETWECKPERMRAQERLHEAERIEMEAEQRLRRLVDA